MMETRRDERAGNHCGETIARHLRREPNDDPNRAGEKGHGDQPRDHPERPEMRQHNI